MAALEASVTDDELPKLARVEMMLSFSLDTALLSVSSQADNIEVLVTRDELEALMARMNAVRKEWDRRVALVEEFDARQITLP